MLTSVNKLLLLHATIHAKLHMSLLTISSFTQQIITSMTFGFEFRVLTNPGLPITGKSLEVEIMDFMETEIRYDTRCYFNVRLKADISQLNLPHGTDN